MTKSVTDIEDVTSARIPVARGRLIGFLVGVGGIVSLISLTRLVTSGEELGLSLMQTE